MIISPVQKPQASGSIVTISAGIAGFIPIVLDLADDKAPFTSDSVQVAEHAMNLTGSLVVWRKYIGKPVTVSVVALSASDLRLQALLDSNNPVLGLLPSVDFVTMTIASPAGYVRTFTNGILLEGAYAPSMNNNGRFDSREYKFVFSSVI